VCDPLTSVGVQTIYRQKYHDFSLVMYMYVEHVFYIIIEDPSIG